MLISKELAERLAREFRENGKKIVFTNGCFDIIHSGHVKYLSAAKKLGDVLFLGLNSDDSVKRLKGESRPVNYEIDRAEVLSALRYIDYIVIFNEDDPGKLIETIMPHILVKGGDYNAGEVIGGDFVKNSGGEVVILPFVPGKSTTSIIEKLKNN